MAIIRYRGIGSSGVVKDYSPVDNATVLTVADNVRFVGSSVQADYGLSAFPSFGVYYFMMPVDYDVTATGLASVTQSVYWLAQQDPVNVTSPGTISAFDTSADYSFQYFSYGMTGVKLSGCVLSGIPIVGGPRIAPMYRAAAGRGSTVVGGAMEVLPWDSSSGATWVSVFSGEGASAATFRTYKNYCLALNTIENNVGYPRRLRWSDSVLPGTVPQSWEDTRLDVDAGYKDFDETTGFIVDSLPLQDVNIIYKTDSVWAQEYNSSPSIFNFRKLFDFGVYDVNCIQEFNNQHFVVTKNDIVIHDGVSYRSIVDNRVRSWFDFSSPTTAWGMFTIKHQARNTIYVLGKDLDNNTRSCAFAYNYVTDSWTRRPLPANMRARSAGVSSRSLYPQKGVESSDILVSCDHYAGIAHPLYSYETYRLNDVSTMSNRSATLKISNAPLTSDGSSLRSDPWQEKKVNKLYPLFRNVSPSSAVLTITISGRNDYADTSNTWAITSSVTASQLRWLNIDKVAREIDIQIDSTSATWELHGIDVDVDKVGRY